MSEVVSKEHDDVNSIFQQAWWLDALAPKQWEEVTVKSDGRVVARLPYVIQSKFGFKILRQPPLSQTLGPWVARSGASAGRQLANELDMIDRLLKELPPFDYFSQCLHHSVSCALPFHWHGFTLGLRYTHLLTDLPAAADMAYYRSNIRTDIKKAQRVLTVRTDLSVDKFIAINRLSFDRQGLRLPYDPELLRRLNMACQLRGAAKMYFAEDVRERVHAVAYIVHDEKAAYYLLGGADPSLRSSGAQSLLVWHAIRDAATSSRSFDFEGSMSRGIGNFFRGFNSEARSFSYVEKASSRFKPFLFLRRLRASAYSRTQ